MTKYFEHLILIYISKIYRVIDLIALASMLASWNDDKYLQSVGFDCEIAKFEKRENFYAPLLMKYCGIIQVLGA